MKNPNYMTNPKTIRRHEKYMKIYNEQKDFAKEHGYKTEKRSHAIWSFSKDGEKSVLGFDSEEEVLQFIFEVKPDPKKIFPPYGFNPSNQK